MNEVAAYGGFPMRYPHWRFGMEYEQLTKSYEYGLSKIYEMVINNNPAIRLPARGQLAGRPEDGHGPRAAGTSTSSRTTTSSRKTNRKMIDSMANHATRVRRHIERQGLDKVEGFIDACLCAREPDRSDVAVHRAQARPRSRATRNPMPIKEVPRLRVEGLHGVVHQPARVRGRAAQKLEREREKPKKFPERARARRAAVSDRARAARALGARHPRDRARRGLLLRAPGADQDHERGLGLLLALARS